MKRLLALSLAISMMAPLAACAENETASLPQSGLSASLPTSATSAPAPAPAVYPSVLTGLPVPEGEVPGTRVAAVVVDNSRPAHGFQQGLSQAGLLAELPVEGGLTRFLAFYENYAQMPTVGPVRSSRDAFLQLAMPFQPLFICEGAGQMHTWYADAFEQHERILQNTAQRMPDLAPGTDAPEYSYFVTGALAAQRVAEREIDDLRSYNSSFFHFLPFGAPARTPSGGSAEAVRIVFSSSCQTYFDYDSVTHRYLMSRATAGQAAAPATDAGNSEARLGFSNLLVLFAEMPVYEGTGTLLDIRFGQGGAGFYFSGGGWQKVLWHKDSPQHTLTLVDAADGATPVELNLGTTYLAVADVEQAARLSFGPPGGEITLQEREA